MGLGLGGLAILTLKRKLATLSPGLLPTLHRATPPYLSLGFYTSVLAELLGSKCFETVTASDTYRKTWGWSFCLVAGVLKERGPAKQLRRDVAVILDFFQSLGIFCESLEGKKRSSS